MTYFVTENYIKAKTTITQNVDSNAVVPWIEVAVEIELMPLIGEEFTNYLLGKYNSMSLSSDEELLIINIQKFIAWKAAELATEPISRPLKNTGVQKLNSENSQPAEADEVKTASGRNRTIASNYRLKLINYLKKNKEKFTQFLDGNNEAEIKDKHTQQLGGESFDIIAF